MSTVAGLPDLLRRFVETPYRFKIVLCSTFIAFETNDQELLSIFRARAEQLLNALRAGDQPWRWKIVRDDHVPLEGSRISVLSGEMLTTIFIGTGTIVAIDHGRSELLGFVAANVHAEHLLDALLDAAQQHLSMSAIPGSNHFF